MTTIRTLRKLTRVAGELEQLTRAMGQLGEAAQATAPAFAKLSELARHAPAMGHLGEAIIKGRIERA